MIVISRRDAKAQGFTHYFTGEPCPAGHITARRVLGPECPECARIRRVGDKPRTRGKVHVDYVTKSEALVLGLRRYFTGRHCAQGHIAERAVSNHVCVECGKVSKEKRRAARRKKPKQVRIYGLTDEERGARKRILARARYAAHVESERIRCRKYRATNTDAVTATQRKYRTTNRAAINARQRKRRIKPKQEPTP